MEPIGKDIFSPITATTTVTNRAVTKRRTGALISTSSHGLSLIQFKPAY